MYLDNPITSQDADVLNRAPIASEFAKTLLTLDLSEGAVVAILGAWGSGKTSFVNITKEELERNNVQFFEFNPWMYQGISDLIERFFVEVCLQIKKGGKLIQLGKDLEKYVRSFPGIIGGASRAFVKLLQGHDLRSTVEKTLRKLEFPLVVFIDDIDRLPTQEIRQIFQLVRLTGKFPNIVYLLAFDRTRVENALEDEGITGRDYLEKIVQWSFDLPAIPQRILQKQISSSIRHTLSGISDTSSLDSEDWIELTRGVVFPLIRNMRDINRYSIAIQSTCKNLNGMVQLTDVLGLEAIRIFLPNIFNKLHENVHLLTPDENQSIADDTYREISQSFLHNLIKSEARHPDVIKSMLVVLFPYTEQYLENTSYDSKWQADWLKNRRVAHQSVLLYYLESVLNDDLMKFVFSEIAFSKMTDMNSFNQYLQSIDLQHLEDTISSLKNFISDFTIEHVVPGASVLLNFVYRLPNIKTGMFEPNGELTILRLVYQLFLVVRPKDRVEELVVEILQNVDTLSSKLSLIQMVGYQRDVGFQLVSTVFAKQLESNWRRSVRECSSDDLRKEPKLLLVILTLNEMSAKDDANIEIDSSQEMTLALLRSAHFESMHTKGDHVELERHLLWDELVSIFGDENILINRVNQVRDIFSDDAPLLELTKKYASGWRPREF